MTATEVRAMHWTDLPAVHDIEVVGFPDSAWSLETFWSELAGVPASRAYWVAQREGRVVGYAGLRAVPPDADVQSIAVAGDHQRTGVATVLLTSLIAEAGSRGCRTLLLEVGAENRAAQALYEHHGFEPMARRSSYYGPGRDALIMRLTLPGESR